MKRTYSLWISVVLLVSSAAFADVYYVDGGGQTAVDDDRAAAVELVQSAVGELGHQTTEDATKADYTLRPRLLRLGSAYILKLEKRKAGNVIFSSQLKAQQPEELDRVAKRLTRAVINNQPASDSARASDVTNEEVHEGTNRKQAISGYHFALGPSLPQNMGTSGVGYSFSLGKAWDLNKAMIRLRGDLFGKGGALGLDFGLSGQYYFINSDFSPFAGAELGFGALRTNTGTIFSNDLHAGFFLGPVAGVQLFRTSSVQVELGLKWSVMLVDTNPSFFAFRVGLYF